MNTVRQRDALKTACRVGIINPDALHTALAAPVFHMPRTRTEPYSATETDWIQTHLMQEHSACPKWLPYPCFRLATDFVWYQCWRCEPDLHLVAWVPSERSNLPAFKAILGQSDSGQFGGKLWILDERGRTIPTEVLQSRGASDEEFNHFMEIVTNVLVEFLLSVSAAATVVKVSERRPGKSVEWHLAREHYLLLPAQVAHAMSTARTGLTDRLQRRAAHWRRAHFRRLTHPAFRHKLNQVVPVREAWIGPTEWQGLDGKIYAVQPHFITPPPA